MSLSQNAQAYKFLRRQRLNYRRYRCKLRIKFFFGVKKIIKSSTTNSDFLRVKTFIYRHQVSSQNFPKRSDVSSFNAIKENVSHKMRVFKFFRLERGVSLQGLRP